MVDVDGPIPYRQELLRTSPRLVVNPPAALWHWLRCRIYDRTTSAPGQPSDAEPLLEPAIALKQLAGLDLPASFNSAWLPRHEEGASDDPTFAGPVALKVSLWPLDLPFVSLIAQYDPAAIWREQNGDLQPPASPPKVLAGRTAAVSAGTGLSLAERFAAAYASRAARITAVRERNAILERRRTAAKRSHAQQAAAAAEAGVNLIGRRLLRV